MNEQVIKLFIESGISGLSLGIFAWLFLKMMKEHRSERDEFRSDIHQDRKATRDVLEKLNTTIENITKK